MNKSLLRVYSTESLTQRVEEAAISRDIYFCIASLKLQESVLAYYFEVVRASNAINNMLLSNNLINILLYSQAPEDIGRNSQGQIYFHLI